MVRPLHIKNARIWNGNDAQVRDLYTTDVVQAAPAHDALLVDLEGYTIFPGLINAHDHLELNHYPRTKFREVYNNAHEWGEDVNARLNESPFKELRAYPLWDRLFIGGLKNLLCGATTVAHHNPPHKELFRKDFPVRVLRKYGWAHSLHFSTDEEIVASYRSTPKDAPWFIHLAEGTDEAAAGEYQRLKALNCLELNTIIVHGVGLTVEDVMDSHSIAGKYRASHGSQMPVVWCPTTNIYLLAKTGHPRMGWNTQLLLGSDSRLTADGDLLDEMRYVSEFYREQDGASIAVSMATQTSFRSHWELKDRVGRLRADNCADFVVITNADNPARRLCQSRRKDLALVVKGGVPQIGDPEVMAKFPHVRTVGATLDGRPKSIHQDLAKRIHLCQLKEAGLEVEAVPKRRLFARGQ
jgi:cytosine/adenosine deaminase-related metal-dependent hydrolase